MVPFAQGSIDFIYASHLIEHLRQDQATAFLGECYRVLKDGGILRVVVPDLRAIVSRYVSAVGQVSNEGEDSAADIFLNELSIFESKKHTLLERILGKGNWHLWMYDEGSLTCRLKRIGFSDTAILTYRKGQTPDIDSIEAREKDRIYIEGRK